MYLTSVGFVVVTSSAFVVVVAVVVVVLSFFFLRLFFLVVSSGLSVTSSASSLGAGELRGGDPEGLGKVEVKVQLGPGKGTMAGEPEHNRRRVKGQ